MVIAMPQGIALRLFALLAVTGGGLGGWLGAQPAPEPAPARIVRLLGIDGAIGPATSHYVMRGIVAAARDGSPLIVIEIDTPGGLDTAMREIVRAILASPVPVVAFVHPQGARAASAGTYIVYASHVAAMAPATNLGAATPVAVGGIAPSSAPDGEDAAPREGDDGPGDAAPADDDAAPAGRSTPAPGTASERKSVNDAVAYIRSLAEQRGRNADWAERAVRSAESLSAQAALDNDVIDLIAADLADLLVQLDGRQVELQGRTVTLATAGLLYERVEPDWRTRILSVIGDPTIAYLLLLLGIYGLLFEGYNPGAVLPGVVGAISLLLALFAFQVLPVNYAGLALIVLGVALMVAEFFVASFGALGLGGIAAFVFGSVILIDVDLPGYGISTPLLIGIATTAALVLLGVVWLAMRSRRRPVVSGVEELLHSFATALEAFDHEGPVRTHGERWQARSASPVRQGQRLKVVAVEDLVLIVEPDNEPN